MKNILSISVVAAILGHSITLFAQPASQFTIADLGTLSGSASDVAAINEAGHVSGRSTTAGGDLHGYFWTPETGMIDIGTLGGRLTYPMAMNDRDQVVGYSQIGSNKACVQATCNHGFLWTAKIGIIDLGTVDNQTTNVVPLFINNRREIVGYYHTLSRGPGIGHGIERPFLWTPKTGMIDLGSLPGDSSGTAVAINSKGKVVGWSFDCGIGASCSVQSFLWTSDQGFVGLGTLGGKNSNAIAINDKGEITGVSDTISSSHAFLWTDHLAMRDLGTLGSTSSAAAINDRGDIVGTYLSYGQMRRPFLWTHGRGMLDIGSLGGSFSSAGAINNRGEVVGTSNTLSASHAFFWTQWTGMIDLGTLANGTTSEAVGINADGQIAGFSDGGNGSYVHAVLWTPRRN